MEVKVYRRDGSETGRTVELDPSIFDIEPNDHAIWLDVRAIQANARQGTHKAKERSEVSGSTRKLYRQKGTGFARAGDAKSPTRRSGGTMFGPRPRDYALSINKKTKRLARRSAFAYKKQGESILVLENFSMDQPRTKEIAALLKAHQLTGKRVLILTENSEPMIYKSSRNIQKVVVRSAGMASTLDVMKAKVVLFQEGALTALSSVLGQNQPATETAE